MRKNGMDEEGGWMKKDQMDGEGWISWGMVWTEKIRVYMYARTGWMREGWTEWGMVWMEIMRVQMCVRTGWMREGWIRWGMIWMKIMGAKMGWMR